MALSERLPPQRFHLPFACPNNRVPTCEALKLWAQIGISLDIEIMSVSALLPKMVEGKVSVYVLGCSTFTFDALYVLENLFYMGKEANEKNHNGSQYKLPVVNRIIEQLRLSQDEKTRNWLIQQVFDIVYRDLPVIPLYLTLDTVALQRQVRCPFITDYSPDLERVKVL